MKFRILIPLLCFFLLACGLISPTVVTPVPITPVAAATPFLFPSPSAIFLEPTPTIAPPPTLTLVPTDLSITEDHFFIYPVAEIYAGERVTFQVFPFVPEQLNPHDVELVILVEGTTLVDHRLSGRNLNGDAMGLFEWVWDTTGLDGEYEIEVILDPRGRIIIGDENLDNNSLTVTVTVQPRSAPPASWVSIETNYAILYAISGTAAERDLLFLSGEIDRAIQQAMDILQETPQRKYEFYFINRVIGQGGYASSVITISYLDRHYAGKGLYEVLMHEAIHLLDQQFAPNRLTFWAEGIAVWGTGGHYKPENLDRRAAALLQTTYYVPLAELINNFYPAQHEVSYLQAASFFGYLVRQYGWPQVKTFYGSMDTRGALNQAEAVSLHLQTHFGKTLPQLEEEWLAYLSRQPWNSQDLNDLLTTIRFYETMRRYQNLHDPTAYYLTAWLPYPPAARERGITADLLRQPIAEVNVTLESMLVSADLALREGDFGRANVLLDSVNRVLDNDGAFLDPLAADYWRLVQAAAALGYEVQRISINGSQATVLITEPNSPHLVSLQFRLNNQGWMLAQ
ncbi:MAG: hypothetical protein KJ063_06120 [Anaerolineae bacterium]|nr:hypothetical protein [Anaerolineae bacterium]